MIRYSQGAAEPHMNNVFGPTPIPDGFLSGKTVGKSPFFGWAGAAPPLTWPGGLPRYRSWLGTPMSGVLLLAVFSNKFNPLGENPS